MTRPQIARVGLLLLVTALAAFWLGQRQQGSTGADMAMVADTVKSPAEPEVLYWYDPMVPDQRFDKPGKSPFMDMQLVPKYADTGSASGDGDGIRIDPRLVQNLGVRTVEIGNGMLDNAIHAVGTVAFNADLIERVTAPVDGIVQHLARRSDLLPVTRGEQLAKLLAPEWAAAQAEYLSLLKSASNESSKSNPALRSLQHAARSRLTLLGMSEYDVRQLETRRRSSDAVWLSSPIDGVIASVDVTEGDTLRRGDALFSIAGLDRVWVDAEVDGADGLQLKAGDAVRVHSDALPGQTYDGEVVALLPAVDATTRRRRLRIVVPNPDHVLVPGMYVSVDASPSGMQHGLLLPSEALIVTGTRRAVVVRDGDDHFRIVDVETGASDSTHTLVRSGLRKGDQVVVSGQFLIDSEASLRQQGSRFSEDADGENSGGDAQQDGSSSRDHDMQHDMPHDMGAMQGDAAMNHDHAMPAAPDADRGDSDEKDGSP